MRTLLQVLEATEGGTRRHLRDLVGALDPTEFRVALAVSNRRAPDFVTDVAAYVSRGLSVTEIPMRREIAPLSDVVSLIRLIRCVHRVRPDLIHAHSAKAGVLSRLAGAVCGIPVVYTPHAFPFMIACGLRTRRFYRFLERCARDLTSALIAVSEEEKQEALSLGYPCGRVYLISNGVTAGGAGGEVNVRTAGTMQVGFFGRLTRQKGADVLLDAVPDVVAHVPQTQFVFYGDGDLAVALRHQAALGPLAAHVRFGGAYVQGEAVSLMRQVDVVTVPSRWEGCPYVVLEAFQAGVPVVASSVGGVKDLIEDGVNGLCVEAGSPEALCDALLALLRDPQKRRQFAERGRATVAMCTVQAMAKAVAEVYRAVLAGRETARR